MKKKRGKKYLEAIKLIDKKANYNLIDAINLVKKTSISKFDATVNLSVNLSAKIKQLVRCSVILPHGNGKIKKILAITNSQIIDAKNAGADFFGGKDLIDKIVNDNWFDYDVIVVTPDVMAEIGKIGHILGPKGLMPNPKNGTISTDIKKAISEIKQGKISFCSDKDNNINLGFAKSSFDNDKIENNFRAVFSSIIKNRPSSLKGNYINSVFISTTMGPSVKINTINL